MLETPASSMINRSIPKAQTAGGRHAVLHGPQVVLVDALGLVVAELSEPGLRLEPPALVDRVVELAERVRELAAADDQLEPLDKEGSSRCSRASGTPPAGSR